MAGRLRKLDLSKRRIRSLEALSFRARPERTPSFLGIRRRSLRTSGLRVHGNSPQHATSPPRAHVRGPSALELRRRQACNKIDALSRP